MAKLIIKNHTEFKLWPEDDGKPEIPYYRVYVTVEGKNESLDGEMVFNWEDEMFNYRWGSPPELDELDQIWDCKIADQAEDYLIKKTGKNPVFRNNMKISFVNESN